jgi:hypothetical protein
MRWLFALVPFTLIGLALMYGMLAAFPGTDDVLWEYMLALYGPDFFVPGLMERPISGYYWQALAETGYFWWPQIIGNVISWIALAMINTWLFAWIFPDHRKVAIAAGLFAISPLLLELQHIIACSYVPMNALSQLPLVLLLRNYKSTWAWIACLVLALVGLVAAGLVTEYVVATSAGISTLLIAKLYFGSDRNQRLRDGISLALLIVVVIGTYGVFVSLRDEAFRSAVESDFLLADGWSRFIKLPFRMVSAFYTATIGAILRELAVLNINTKEAIVGTLFGLMIAGLSVLVARATRGEVSRWERPFRGYEWPVLFLAFSAAMLPALLMGRRPDDVTFLSRFYFPALPMAAVGCVAIFKLLLGLRDWAIVALFGFLAGYASLSEGMLRGGINREVNSWAEQIRPHLDEDGMTVAVVMLGKERFWPYNLDDDLLTSRIGRFWPLELRRRFYASNSIDEIGPGEASARRGAVINYPVTRVLLVMPKGFDEGVSITEIDKSKLPPGLLTKPQFPSPPPVKPRAESDPGVLDTP